MSDTQTAPKSALERLEQLEAESAALRADVNKVADVLGKIHQAFLTSHQALERNSQISANKLDSTATLAEFLAETATALVSLLQERQVISDSDMVSKVNQLKEDKKKEHEENLIKGGFLTEGEIASVNSVVVGRSANSAGVVLAPREHFDISRIEGDNQTKFIGSKVGDVLEFDGGFNITVLRVLDAVFEEEQTEEVKTEAEQTNG
jgi:hypothetical protein